MTKILEKRSANYQKIKEAINYIDTNFKNQPSIDDIALHVKLSKFHLVEFLKSM